MARYAGQGWPIGVAASQAQKGDGPPSAGRLIGLAVLKQ